MDLQDIAFLPTRASVYVTFLKDCGEIVGTTTYVKTVVGSKQGCAACKIFCSNKASFCVS